MVKKKKDNKRTFLIVVGVIFVVVVLSFLIMIGVASVNPDAKYYGSDEQTLNTGRNDCVEQFSNNMNKLSECYRLVDWCVEKYDYDKSLRGRCISVALKEVNNT